MRLASIDILRAITMVLMIWVNDFWTLTDIPKWLQHANATEDYLGFSDIIFPLFLFIVGLSIPLAIKSRMDKGNTKFSIAKHIIIRSISLLVIGFFMVNYETAHDESIIIGTTFWELLMALAVVLIWTNWKRSPLKKKWHPYLPILGFIILIFLASIYKGGENGSDWMTTQWWGILGLIGWAYILNALVYVYSKGSLVIMSLLWLLLILLAVLDHSEMSMEFKGLSSFFSTILTGTIPAFTAAGIVATLLFKRMQKSGVKWGYFSLILLGILNLIFGLVTRPIWGISKIQATPSWLGICTGIGFLLFAVLYYIADEKKHSNWAKIIAPAGTATLTCYMIPYFVYPLRSMSGIRAPEFLSDNLIGLLLSFAFAILVVIFTGWLEKKGFKLKL